MHSCAVALAVAAAAELPVLLERIVEVLPEGHSSWRLQRVPKELHFVPKNSASVEHMGQRGFLPWQTAKIPGIHVGSALQMGFQSASHRMLAVAAEAVLVVAEAEVNP